MGLKNPFDYKTAAINATVPLGNASTYSKIAVSFPSSENDGEPCMGNVTGICYFPTGTAKSPLVILAHGIGDSSIIPCHALARTLARSGIASFVIYLPIHSRRLPKDMKERFYNLTLDEWFELYRVSVVNIRQVLDWAQSRHEIDSDKIGIAGISFGGYVAGIALGIDDRLKAGALLLSCGNQEKLGWTRSTRRIPRYNVSEAVYKEGQKRYMAYVEEVSAHGFENVVVPRPSYSFDPFTFCSTIKTKPVFLANAIWDEYFPRVAAKEFWQACGRPNQLWLPSGHATAWLFYPLIRSNVVKLFRQAFLT